jgi:hypothetical protein
MRLLPKEDINVSARRFPTELSNRTKVPENDKTNDRVTPAALNQARFTRSPLTVFKSTKNAVIDGGFSRESPSRFVHKLLSQSPNPQPTQRPGRSEPSPESEPCLPVDLRLNWPNLNFLPTDRTYIRAVAVSRYSESDFKGRLPLPATAAGRKCRCPHPRRRTGIRLQTAPADGRAAVADKGRAVANRGFRIAANRVGDRGNRRRQHGPIRGPGDIRDGPSGHRAEPN